MIVKADSSVKKIFQQLLKGDPLPVKITGAYYFSKPVIDSNGNVCIVWRGITGNVETQLAETIFLLKLDKSGKSVSGDKPISIGQAMYTAIDAESGGGASGLIADGVGGLFYLCGPCVIHIDSDGKANWGKGSLYPNEKDEVWKYPSPVKYCPLKYVTVNSAKLFTDGTGNALIVWNDYDNKSGGSSIRAQKINADGKLLWPERGTVILTDKENLLFADAVGDGKGGMVARISSDYYAEDCHVAYYSSEGNVVRKTENLGINLSKSEVFFTVSDGNGGIFILYLVPSYDDPTGVSYKEPHLARVDALGNKVFDAVISSAKSDLTYISLSCNEPEIALISWRNYDAYAEPNAKTRLYLNRVDGQGIQNWGKELIIELQGQVGQYQRENYDGVTEMVSSGKDTFVFYENLVECDNDSGAAYFLFLQKIADDGSLQYSDIGKPVSDVIGHTPYLIKSYSGVDCFFFKPEIYRTNVDGEDREMKEVPFPYILKL